jgi:hypothetical protein
MEDGTAEYTAIVRRQAALVRELAEAAVALRREFDALPATDGAFDGRDVLTNWQDAEAFHVGFDLPAETARRIALANFATIAALVDDMHAGDFDGRI